jgi:leucyl aminopeptidase (aminopeptidase T)
MVCTNFGIRMIDYVAKAKEILYDHCLVSEGDQIVIIYQEAPSDCPSDLKQSFIDSKEVCDTLLQACVADGVPAEIKSYVPSILRNGVEPPSEFTVEADLILAPTVFSITHTSFVKNTTARRVATLPGFKPYMFETVGNREELLRITNETFAKLSNAKRVHVTGAGTDMLVEVNPALVLESSGFLETADMHNIPGAEVFCVPKTANGYFTVPVGFGGKDALPSPIKFTIADGRFVDFEGDVEVLEKYIAPNFAGKDFNVLAELGIGTNPNITPEYMKRTGWSTLLAEKIYGSAHFANGNSKGMGGDNDVPIHIDWVVPDVKIEYIE